MVHIMSVNSFPNHIQILDFSNEVPKQFLEELANADTHDLIK